jgi:dTDP-4-amino-4,6-dideoxygalactose transaminase
MIPHSKPWITSADLEAVTTVLESGMIARGTQVADLKASIAVYVGSVWGHCCIQRDGSFNLRAVQTVLR